MCYLHDTGKRRLQIERVWNSPSQFQPSAQIKQQDPLIQYFSLTENSFKYCKEGHYSALHQGEQRWECCYKHCTTNCICFKITSCAHVQNRRSDFLIPAFFVLVRETTLSLRRGTMRKPVSPSGSPGSVCKLNHRKLCQSPERHSAHTEWEKEREGAFSGTGTGGHVEVFIWGSSWGKLCRIHISPENALAFFFFVFFSSPLKKEECSKTPLVVKVYHNFHASLLINYCVLKKGGSAALQPKLRSFEAVLSF